MSRIRGRREWTVGVVLLAAFAVNLSLTFLTIAVKEIASTFDATPLDAGWVTFAPMVISALLTPAFARAADMYGRMRTWILGLGVVIVGMALSAVAPTLAFLVIARVVTGVGAAAVMPAGLALLTAAYPPTVCGVVSYARRRFGRIGCRDGMTTATSARHPVAG